MNKEEMENAISNYTPQIPNKHELGGDYYYKCHWLMCNADIKQYMNYCWKCGQRIDWNIRK